MDSKNSPLTDKHLALLNKLLAATAETDKYCEDCKACGIDVSPEQRRNTEQQVMAQKIKARFFPNAA